MADHIRYAREEIVQKYKDAQLVFFKKVLIPGGVMWAVILSVMGVTLLLSDGGKSGGAAVTVLLVVGLVAIIGFLAWFFKTLIKTAKIAKSLHPACPACGESIDFKGRGKLLKTSACPFCSEVIIEG